MCLAIPGKVISLDNGDRLMLMGKVDFGGVIKQICLAYVPDIKIGEYVVVHVGFAISKIDEQEARRVFAYLEEMDDLSELTEQEMERD